MATEITRQDRTVLRGWPAGVNNVRGLRDLNRGDAPALRAGVNVDITTTGKVRMRKGRTLVQAGLAHSLYSPPDWPIALLVLDGQLRVLRNDGGAETLTMIGGLSQTAPLSFCEQNDHILASNGLVTFRVTREGALRAWGVPIPQGMPLATPAANGTIPPGRYQLTLTNVADDGEESGARAPMLIEMAADGSIQLSDIPQPGAGVASIRVYLTHQNGADLYLAASLPVGTTTHTLFSLANAGKGLETLHCERVPASRWLCSYRGRVYFAIGDTVYYTLPLRYGLFKAHQTYFRFPHRVTGIAATEDALIVGTQHAAYRLLGADPADMAQVQADPSGVVEGTMLRLPGGVLPGEGFNAGNVVWWSNRGVLMRAGPGGVVTPMTQGRLALPRFASGAVMYREQDEIAQIVSILRGPQSPAAFAASDHAEAEIVRNGISM